MAVCLLPVAYVSATWFAGRAASWATGHGWSGPQLDLAYARRIASPEGLASAWPGVPQFALYAANAALFVAGLGAVVLVTWLWMHVPPPDAAIRSLARPGDLQALAPHNIGRSARRLRRGLAGNRQPDPGDAGVPLGRLVRRGPATASFLRASWEDVLLCLMAPRSGKTTALAVPAILEAPGPVIATSNKADLWLATASLRQARTGDPVGVFDPQRIVHAEQTWWWNPLQDVTTVEEAHRLAGHFIQEVRDPRRGTDFWASAAHDLLTGLLLAAGLSGRNLNEVYEWLNDPILRAPIDILRDHGRQPAAASLQGRMDGAPETRDGVYETARTAAQCLRDDAILTWVTPPADTELSEFDPHAFVTSRQTIHLLSKDSAGAAAPLVAALTDRILRSATAAAERAGGRLDPPLVAVLDEAANICRISDLPDLYSHLGSRGIVPLTILQSYKQGVRVWGDHGMDALWSAATIKIIGPGLDDARFAEDVSRLIGDHDVPIRSIAYQRGGSSHSTSIRRQRILPPEALRALPKGRALLLATGIRPALIRLRPWYHSPDAEAIETAIARASRELTARAQLRRSA